MEQYLSLMREVLGNGDVVFEPRTQTYTIGLGGAQRVFDLRKGFPALTTKPVPVNWTFEELFWKARGGDNVHPLVARGVDYWTANAYDLYLRTNGLTEQIPKHSDAWNRGFAEFEAKIVAGDKSLGALGPVYGAQWRRGFEREGKPIDQLVKAIDLLRNESTRFGRYALITAWNPAQLKDMAIGPCPMTHHFGAFVDDNEQTWLDLHTFQRSCDVYLGVPCNIAQESLFDSVIAKAVGVSPRFLYHTYSNVHIYLGVKDRGKFWVDNHRANLREFRARFKGIDPSAPNASTQYLELREWYLSRAPAEEPGDKAKDHVPLVLMQLSRPTRPLSTLELEGVDLLEALDRNLPARKIARLRGYTPDKNWDHYANMAA